MDNYTPHPFMTKPAHLPPLVGGSFGKLAALNFSPYLVNGATIFPSKGVFPVHLQPNASVHSPPSGSDIQICMCKTHQSSRARIVYPQFQLVQEG